MSLKVEVPYKKLTHRGKLQIQDQIKELLKLSVRFNLSLSLDDCVHNMVIQELFANYIKLLHFLKIFPIAAVRVERFFSKIKPAEYN